VESNLWLMEQMIASRTEDLQRSAESYRQSHVSASSHASVPRISWRLGDLLIRAGQRLTGPDLGVRPAFQPHPSWHGKGAR
jgi:hypothetical protein